MARFGRVSILLWLFVLLGIGPALAQAPPPHIQAAQDFLLAWGKGNWDVMRARAGEEVTVRVGEGEYTIDIAGRTADVQLIFPFRGLSTVRVGGSVKGITVDEITVRAGGEERRGQGTVTLEEKDGTFLVTAIAVE